MKKIIPITDLQRQAGQIVSDFDEAAEPVIITQRGRAAAVLMPVARYQQMEEDLARLDELELRDMLCGCRSTDCRGTNCFARESKRANRTTDERRI